LQKPARWRETISLSIVTTAGKKYLFPRSYDYCRILAPDPAVTGEPRYYADYEYEHFLIAPTPSSNYTFELAYFERPVPLDTTNEVSWTTQYAPQLLLYATLLEAQPYLKRPDLASVWQQAYDRALQALGTETNRQYNDRTQQRSSV